MKHSPLHLLVIGSAVCMLVACSSGGPKVDVGWIGESVSSPQNDTVINETGQSLPALSALPSQPKVEETSSGSGGGFLSQIQKQPSAQGTAQSTAPAVSQPVATTATTTGTYIVKQGDTLSAIAARHGVSTSSLISLNGLSANPNALRIGQVLRIPGAAAAASMPSQSSTVPVRSTSSYRTYTVASGDTLSGIAARYGTTVSAIMAINGFTPDSANRLRIGQTIKLP